MTIQDIVIKVMAVFLVLYLLLFMVLIIGKVFKIKPSSHTHKGGVVGSVSNITCYSGNSQTNTERKTEMIKSVDHPTD